MSGLRLGLRLLPALVIWGVRNCHLLPCQLCLIYNCLSRIGPAAEQPRQSEQKVVVELSGHPVHCREREKSGLTVTHIVEVMLD